MLVQRCSEKSRRCWINVPCSRPDPIPLGLTFWVLYTLPIEFGVTFIPPSPHVSEMCGRVMCHLVWRVCFFPSRGWRSGTSPNESHQLYPLLPASPVRSLTNRILKQR